LLKKYGEPIAGAGMGNNSCHVHTYERGLYLGPRETESGGSTGKISQKKNEED